jgi:uncharacterized phage-associated protein
MIGKDNAMNLEKLMEACGYLISKYDHRRVNYTKLIKLLYLSDRKALEDSLDTITGDSYVCMKMGPVLSNSYNLIKGRSTNNNQTLWNSRFAINGDEICMLSDQVLTGELSQYECAIMDSVDKEYHDKTYTEIVDIVHEMCPEWINPGRGSLPLPVEKILKGIGCSDEEISWRKQRNAEYSAEDKIFASVGNRYA